MISINRNLLSFAIPFGLFAILVYAVQTFVLLDHRAMTLAISVDLLITIPFVYFLLIRNTTIPNTTVVPMMVVGLVIGGLVLPKEHQIYLDLFKVWALPLVELSITAFIVMKMRTAFARYRSLKDDSIDFFSLLKDTCSEVLPKKLVLPLATELAVFYYGFIKWRSKPTEVNEFTYHKTSGTPALFGAVIFIIGVETFALHLLLVQWNFWIAWILSILSIYTAIQVLGFAKSLAYRPISIQDNFLVLRHGILNEVKIPYEDIDSVELSGKSVKGVEGAKTLSPLGELEGTNVILYLRRERTLLGLYGIKTKFITLALYVDQKVEFVQRLEGRMQ